MSKKSIPFFIINDESRIIHYLSSIIEKIYPESDIYSFDDSSKALRALNEKNLLSVIICDFHLEGISGMAILEKIRNNKKINSSYFIFLTEGDKDQNLRAMKLGADEFITKPLKVDEVISKLRSAYRIRGYQNENIELRETIEEFEEIIRTSRENAHKLLQKFRSIRFPDKDKIFNQIQDASVWIAAQYDETTPADMEIISKASSLVGIGKLFLPDNSIDNPVMKKGMLNGEIMKTVPEFAKELILHIRGYEEVAKIIYHVFENFDGSGIPKQLQKQQIPLASRIIRVAYDFQQYLQESNQSYGKAIESIYHENKRLYDFRIVSLYDQYLATKGIGVRGYNEVGIDPESLRQGMMLTRNVTTETGTRLMAANILLTREKIEKMLILHEKEPVIGKIFVKK